MFDEKFVCWSQGDGYYESTPNGFAWLDNESDSEYWSRLGYTGTWYAGNTDFDYVTVYKHVRVQNVPAPAYVFEIGSADTIDYVAVWKYVDALALRDKLFARFPVSSSDFEEVLVIIKRAFRAWHGHDSVCVCAECDPLETKRLHDLKRHAAKLKDA